MSFLHPLEVMYVLLLLHTWTPEGSLGKFWVLCFKLLQFVGLKCRVIITENFFFKETGERVGTVVNVFNSGASDLLHVELKSSVAKQNPGDAGPLVWVPFVEAIVPDIDLQKREMLITPPKGLLELNVRSDERSKKERRQLVRSGKQERNFKNFS